MDYSIDSTATNSDEYPAFRRLLESVMGDHNATGWDQPTRVYQITGDMDDPMLELLTEQMLHPIGILDAAYHQDMTLDGSAIGLVVSTESWAAVSFDEMTKAAPHIFDDLIAHLQDKGFDEETINSAARSGWAQFLDTIPFAELPDELHREVRTLIVVLRDGTVMLCSHTRDSGKTTFTTPGNAGQDDFGFVPESMRLFLNGEHPVPASQTPEIQVFPMYLPGTEGNNDYYPFS